jgi:EAL domain-containing protein (putative c-di-GMP-specific phosphodiesterase class I)
MALYRAKSDGRGIYRFFEPEMDALMQARRVLELDLRRALIEQEFELYYQPLLNVQANRITGFEALLRWHHPQRGLVAPGEFIALAEEIGLIVPIGDWVLRQACREAATWPDDVRVAVNLSPVQFKSEKLLESVIMALATSKLAPHRLELEITEGVLLMEHEATLAVLHQLRALGVSIAMDDFGTGYSSLSYLRSFPFDKIKIDGSFIRNLSAEDSSLAIIRAVTGLGTSLGMTTTAEGVETSDQFERVRLEGCTEVQGYLISKPRPAADLGELLAACPREPVAAA